MKNFEAIFILVKPIIFKLKREYFIKLWDKDDWLQEGRFVLYRLIVEHPEVMSDETKFYTYFKTKFSNYLKDIVRRQESQKRRFDKLPYVEISEFNNVKNRGLVLDEYVAYLDTLNRIENELDAEGRKKLNKVIAGESFLGKADFMRMLRDKFSDFDNKNIKL